MKKLVEFLVQSLLKDSSKFTVTEEVKGTEVYIKVEVDKNDIGAVIGRGGNVINAIRTIARTKATLENVKVYVDVVDKVS